MYLPYIINQEKTVSVFVLCSNALQSTEDSGFKNCLHFPTSERSPVLLSFLPTEFFSLSYSVENAGSKDQCQEVRKAQNGNR